MKGEAADYHMLVRMIREIKVPRDRFRCVLVVFLPQTEYQIAWKSVKCIPQKLSQIYRKYQGRKLDKNHFLLKYCTERDAQQDKGRHTRGD